MTEGDVARFFQMMAPLSLTLAQAQLSTEMNLLQDTRLFWCQIHIEASCIDDLFTTIYFCFHLLLHIMLIMSGP